jgi:hypothetical protein
MSVIACHAHAHHAHAPMPMPTMPGAAAQLVMPMPIMIWLAVLVEAATGNWVDMLILLLIQFVNAFIAWCAPAGALPPPPAARCGLAVKRGCRHPKLG